MASFICPVCGAESHNPHDLLEGYCGACHDWTGDLAYMRAKQMHQLELGEVSRAYRPLDIRPHPDYL